MPRFLRLWESCRCVFDDFKNDLHGSEPNRVFRERESSDWNARWWWCVKKYILEHWDTRWLQKTVVRWTSARDVARADPIAEMMKQSVCAVFSLSLVYFFCISFFSLSLSLSRFVSRSGARSFLHPECWRWLPTNATFWVCKSEEEEEEESKSIAMSQWKSDGCARAREEKRERETRVFFFLLIFDRKFSLSLFRVFCGVAMMIKRVPNCRLISSEIYDAIRERQNMHEGNLS